MKGVLKNLEDINNHDKTSLKYKMIKHKIINVNEYLNEYVN